GFHGLLIELLDGFRKTRRFCVDSARCAGGGSLGLQGNGERHDIVARTSSSCDVNYVDSLGGKLEILPGVYQNRILSALQAPEGKRAVIIRHQELLSAG